jgi:hypothetical protein
MVSKGDPVSEKSDSSDDRALLSPSMMAVRTV